MNARIVTFFLLAFMAAAVCGRAEDQKAVKKRMAARLPAVKALKLAKSVGENAKGYLAVLQKSEDARKTVKAENADRKLVYQWIAERTETTAELVGTKRAEQIARQSAPGIMLQGKDGKWYEKGKAD